MEIVLLQDAGKHCNDLFQSHYGLHCGLNVGLFLNVVLSISARPTNFIFHSWLFCPRRPPLSLSSSNSLSLSLSLPLDNIVAEGFRKKWRSNCLRPRGPGGTARFRRSAVASGRFRPGSGRAGGSTTAEASLMHDTAGLQLQRRGLAQQQLTMFFNAAKNPNPPARCPDLSRSTLSTVL